MTAVRQIVALCGRELLSAFLAPLGWIVLTLFLFVQGYAFYLYVELVNHPQAPAGDVMQFFFGGTFLYWLFVIFVVSTITMRLLAEERRSGSLELLLTAPVSEAQVVLGKYLAAVLFYAFLWLPTVIYVVVLAWLSDPVPLSLGTVAAGYVGTLLLGAACLSVGVLCSALSKSQIVSAVLCFALLCALMLLGAAEVFASAPLARAILGHLNLFDQMDDFARGIVDSRHIVVQASLIVFCLVAATKALEAKKWR